MFRKNSGEWGERGRGGAGCMAVLLMAFGFSVRALPVLPVSSGRGTAPGCTIAGAWARLILRELARFRLCVSGDLSVRLWGIGGENLRYNLI